MSERPLLRCIILTQSVTIPTLTHNAGKIYICNKLRTTPQNTLHFQTKHKVNMWSKRIEPEQYFLDPTPHVPNSRLPILVYRDALADTTPGNILNTIEPNGWLKGGQWKTYKVPHFHAACHECYAVIKGKTTYLLGVGPTDPEFDERGTRHGMKLTVQKGDVFVLPVRYSISL